jgi:hypothetical protein
MEKKKKIALAITGSLALATLGYFIYRRQSGAATAIAANTVNPATGLTPLQEQTITQQAGPLAMYEGKMIWSDAGYCYVISKGGFQRVAEGKGKFVTKRVLGVEVKDCPDGVKKGYITKLKHAEVAELKRYALTPEITIYQ